MRHSFLFSFLLIIFTTSGQNTMTKKQVVEDYTIFKNILTQSHPSLYEYTNENEWNDLFSKFEIQLDSIQDSATFFRKLSELGIHVRDGHFNILHYRMQSVPPLFPLLLKIIDEELYHDTNDFDIPLASKIVSIDGISGKDLIQRMYKYAPSDGYNTTRKHRQIEFEFGILHLYEFGSKKSYSVVYETPSGERQTTNIQSQSFQSIGQRHVQRSSLFINFYKSQIDPNYLNQKDNFPKVFFIPSKNTAILKVPSFGVNPEEFKSRVLSIFDDLKKKKIKSLIIDVRKNAGGYRANAITLFSLITDKSFQQRTSEKIITSQLIEKKHIKHTMQDYGSFLNSYFVDSHKKTLTTDRAKKMMKPHKKRFKGKVYVLIDGQTFSAASTFALSAKNDSKIQLVGESTGGGYYFHTGQFPVTYQLPHSKNFIRISLVHINHFVKDKTLPKGSGVLPDNEINLTRQDLIKGEDTVMKHVLEKASQ